MVELDRRPSRWRLVILYFVVYTWLGDCAGQAVQEPVRAKPRETSHGRMLSQGTAHETSQTPPPPTTPPSAPPRKVPLTLIASVDGTVTAVKATTGSKVGVVHAEVFTEFGCSSVIETPLMDSARILAYVF